MSDEGSGHRYGADPVRAEVCQMRGCDRRATQLLAEYGGGVVHACDECAAYLSTRLDMPDPTTSWRGLIRDPGLLGLGCIHLVAAVCFALAAPSGEYSWAAVLAVGFAVPGLILISLGLVSNNDEPDA